MGSLELGNQLEYLQTYHGRSITGFSLSQHEEGLKIMSSLKLGAGIFELVNIGIILLLSIPYWILVFLFPNEQVIGLDIDLFYLMILSVYTIGTFLTSVVI